MQFLRMHRSVSSEHFVHYVKRKVPIDLPRSTEYPEFLRGPQDRQPCVRPTQPGRTCMPRRRCDILDHERTHHRISEAALKTGRWLQAVYACGVVPDCPDSRM